MSFLSNLSRLCTKFTQVRAIHTTQEQLFKFTPILYAEPLKKKKKLDPAIVKQREDRKRKKIEKQIRRLEKNARQLKPVEELETPLKLLDERKQRARQNVQLTPAELEERVLLEKKWATFKMRQKLADLQTIDRLMMAQEKALNELRLESEELYQEAIQPDLQLIPFKAVGPVSTPPIQNYESPDGEYINISRKWE